MTSTKKSQAKIVDVLPAGRILKKEGDYALIEVSKDKGEWYRLSPPPEPKSEIPTAVELPKEYEILRQVGDILQVQYPKCPPIWTRLIPPTSLAGAKTYFQVMKVQHAVLITNPDAILVRYSRDKSMEWVKNIRVFVAPATNKPKPYKIAGRITSKIDTERAAQIQAGREMAHAM